jgi:TolA-binding protein
MSASVRAFRALTAAPADGAATRARVLAHAGRRRGRRVPWRRFVTVAVVTTAISISASAAWTALAPVWRAAPPIVLSGGEGPSPPARALARPHGLPTIPVEKLDLSPEAGPGPLAGSDPGAEAHLYARAHQAHFVDQSPARALAAWTEYLRRFPRGALAPEAGFNRALCLIHLGRFDEATRALQRFAVTVPDSYRSADVQRLLDWLRAQQH